MQATTEETKEQFKKELKELLKKYNAEMFICPVDGGIEIEFKDGETMEIGSFYDGKSN